MGKNCVFGQSEFLPVCHICGMLLDDCQCPACMVCGRIGHPMCLVIHEYGDQIENLMSEILRDMVKSEVPR